jgi:hypothetical protein
MFDDFRLAMSSFRGANYLSVFMARAFSLIMANLSSSLCGTRLWPASDTRLITDGTKVLSSKVMSTLYLLC